MISKKMKYSRVFRATVGILLASSLLQGCGPRETSVETTPTESESDAAETTAPPSQAPQTSEEATKQPTSSATTSITPPKSAQLTAQQADSQINLRARPTTESATEGYGLVGDRVKLLQAAEGEDNLTWYYVKFDESGAEGWIRGDFISTSGATTSLQQGANADIDSFTTDELFSVGSGGCGMTLWPINSPGEYIFFNGLPNTGMWMKINGDMTQFRRNTASGPEFYGQSASQSFVNSDSSIEVDVTVNVGSEEGYESVNIEQGTLRLESPAGGITEITVEGDAGC
jgi:hypothetical protein